MKCIAIDDEPVALSIIRKFASRLGDITLETYTDPIAGMEAVEQLHPDLLFLDIEMSGVNGVDLARRKPADTALVFTTAYSKYALDGFNLNAIDFLHKPFSYDRFKQAVEKVRTQMETNRLLTLMRQSEESITVKSDYKNVSIRLSDIIYISAMDNYVRIVVESGRPVLTQMSMKEMEAQLPPDQFIRVHKSYMISLRHVASYTRDQIQLHACSQAIPIGRAYQEKVKILKGS